MTMPHSGVVCHPWAGTCYMVNLCTVAKIEKATQTVENGVVRGR